jgi:hypothetical protein
MPVRITRRPPPDAVSDTPSDLGSDVDALISPAPSRHGHHGEADRALPALTAPVLKHLQQTLRNRLPEPPGPPKTTPATHAPRSSRSRAGSWLRRAARVCVLLVALMAALLSQLISALPAPARGTQPHQVNVTCKCVCPTKDDGSPAATATAKIVEAVKDPQKENAAGDNSSALANSTIAPPPDDAPDLGGLGVATIFQLGALYYIQPLLPTIQIFLGLILSPILRGEK